MKHLFGADLAVAYNEDWGNYGIFAWPFILKQVRRRNPGASTWLDLCCGAGAFLQVAIENGFAATGVDQSSHMITIARVKAPTAELLVQDVRELDLNRRFDVITCLHDSLNYITSGADLKKVFRNAHRSLVENGLFIFDMMSYEGLRTNWNGTGVIHDHHRTLIMEQTFDVESGFGRFLFTGFIREGETYRKFQEEHFERGYRPEEIEGWLEEAGFFFKQFDGHSLGRIKKNSGRLLYICERKNKQPSDNLIC